MKKWILLAIIVAILVVIGVIHYQHTPGDVKIDVNTKKLKEEVQKGEQEGKQVVNEGKKIIHEAGKVIPESDPKADQPAGDAATPAKPQPSDRPPAEHQTASTAG